MLSKRSAGVANAIGNGFAMLPFILCAVMALAAIVGGVFQAF